MTRALYRVWVADEYEEDSNKEFPAYAPDRAAIEYAAWAHRHRDGYEWSWPVVFCVRELRANVDEGIGRARNYAGPVYKISVDRDFDPSFYASARNVDPVPPGSHDRFNKDGDPICACCHPFAHDKPCDKCFCTSEKRFWHAMDGGCDWWIVARDVAGCKEVLAKHGAVFCDDDGNEYNAHEHPEKLDECITFDEVPQDTAKRMHLDDCGDKTKALTDHELGAWFSSEH